MKKLFIVAMAAVAMTFTACKKEAPAPVPAENEAPAVEVVSPDSIAAVIEAADSTQLSALLTEAQSKIEELTKIDPAKAKDYLAQIQALLKENADKIKAFAGTGAVATVIDAVNNLPQIEVPDVAGAAQEAAENAAEGVKDAAADAAQDVKDAATEKVEDAKAAVNDAANAAVDKANEVKDAAADKAAGAVDDAANKIKGALGR